MEKMQTEKPGFSIFGSDREAVIQVIVLLLLSALVYILSGKYDFFEEFMTFSRRHESWELDETVSVGVFWVFAFLFLALRQRRKLALSRTTVLEKNESLRAAMAEIKQLKGLIPICAHCKKIRDGEGAWHQLEAYIQQRTDARFSHGICPECMQTLYPEDPEQTP